MGNDSARGDIRSLGRRGRGLCNVASSSALHTAGAFGCVDHHFVHTPVKDRAAVLKAALGGCTSALEDSGLGPGARHSRLPTLDAGLWTLEVPPTPGPAVMAIIAGAVAAAASVSGAKVLGGGTAWRGCLLVLLA